MDFAGAQHVHFLVTVLINHVDFVVVIQEIAMPKISIAIPYHDSPRSAFYLSRLLKSISEQTFTDYEIVITKEGNFARNHNAAIIKSKGEIVQMMQMDDYFAHPKALQNIVNGFTQNVVWQTTACLHDQEGEIGMPHIPQWTDDIWTGNNRLGSVSTFSFKREQALFFEEPLQWLVDVDLYYRLYLKYGLPHLNGDKGIIVDTRHDRLTHTIPDSLKQEEYVYLMKKYA